MQIIRDALKLIISSRDVGELIVFVVV